MTRRVILESPYAGEVERNIEFARACMVDCLKRGEAPFASHLLYTQQGVLDDTQPDEREHGIAAGLAWVEVADATVVYTDFGISDGMRRGIEHARANNRPVEMRELGRARQWGYIARDGAFRALPRAPLEMTGKTPPFDITLPTGEVRHIIERPT